EAGGVAYQHEVVSPRTAARCRERPGRERSVEEQSACQIGTTEHKGTEPLAEVAGKAAHAAASGEHRDVDLAGPNGRDINLDAVLEVHVHERGRAGGEREVRAHAVAASTRAAIEARALSQARTKSVCS